MIASAPQWWLLELSEGWRRGGRRGRLPWGKFEELHWGSRDPGLGPRETR